MSTPTVPPGGERGLGTSSTGASCTVPYLVLCFLLGTDYRTVGCIYLIP